jgi:hypothetical protein
MLNRNDHRPDYFFIPLNPSSRVLRGLDADRNSLQLLLIWANTAHSLAFSLLYSRFEHSYELRGMNPDGEFLNFSHTNIR